MAIRNRRITPVKSAHGKETFGTFRATNPAAVGRPKKQQRRAVQKSIKRTTRFRLTAVKHG